MLFVAKLQSYYFAKYTDYPNWWGRANGEWEISEEDVKFVYAMKLVPPKDIGNIVHLGIILGSIGTWYYSLTSMCFYIIFLITVQTL